MSYLNPRNPMSGNHDSVGGILPSRPPRSQNSAVEKAVRDIRRSDNYLQYYVGDTLYNHDDIDAPLPAPILRDDPKTAMPSWVSAYYQGKAKLQEQRFIVEARQRQESVADNLAREMQQQAQNQAYLRAKSLFLAGLEPEQIRRIIMEEVGEDFLANADIHNILGMRSERTAVMPQAVNDGVAEAMGNPVHPPSVADDANVDESEPVFDEEDLSAFGAEGGGSGAGGAGAGGAGDGSPDKSFEDFIRDTVGSTGEVLGVYNVGGNTLRVERDYEDQTLIFTLTNVGGSSRVGFPISNGFISIVGRNATPSERAVVRAIREAFEPANEDRIPVETFDETSDEDYED